MSNKLLQLFGNSKQEIPSIISDPFKVECIESITIWIRKPLFARPGDGFKFEADVEFKRGDTEGKQTIHGIDLIDIYNKLKEFCENL